MKHSSHFTYAVELHNQDHIWHWNGINTKMKSKIYTFRPKKKSSLRFGGGGGGPIYKPSVVYGVTFTLAESDPSLHQNSQTWDQNMRGTSVHTQLKGLPHWVKQLSGIQTRQVLDFLPWTERTLVHFEKKVFSDKLPESWQSPIQNI